MAGPWDRGAEVAGLCPSVFVTVSALTAFLTMLGNAPPGPAPCTRPGVSFDPHITIDGEFRPDASALAEIADESVQRMREIAESLWVTGRDEIGSVDAPGLTQELALSAVAGGVRRDLVQSQVYLSMLDVDDPSKRSVIRLALTATADQFDSVLEDFREFVCTVRPETRTSA
ncbi:hypothetical protein [Streptomyces sp. RTd22]|uniref:hypothetical protein n=1 Tax=Streptomyces sp. RTd22 TaxID=1841249 RepID=UPI000A59EEF7|nr:hypothetical protein [Streptomyces sp. RTd22]